MIVHRCSNSWKRFLYEYWFQFPSANDVGNWGESGQALLGEKKKVNNRSFIDWYSLAALWREKWQMSAKLHLEVSQGKCYVAARVTSYWAWNGTSREYWHNEGSMCVVEFLACTRCSCKGAWFAVSSFGLTLSRNADASDLRRHFYVIENFSLFAVIGLRIWVDSWLIECEFPLEAMNTNSLEVIYIRMNLSLFGNGFLDVWIEFFIDFANFSALCAFVTSF